MLNLKDLTFSFRATDWQDTFVGIKKNKETEKFEFQLPKGFEDFPITQYSEVKSLFFKTYKTYRKFFEEKKDLAQENQFDGFCELNNGYSIEAKDGQIVSYSKLTMLESILDAYNELLILSVKNKLSRTNQIDYSQIHKYMHKAIFVDEETIIIDEMEFPKKIIDSDSTILIEMFCYIYTEIKQALEEPIESNRAISLSNEFREKHLTFESSIFEEDTFEETMAILKDILDEIDRTTPYKDSDYWHFYDAVYKFLYGENETEKPENGEIWGMTNFAVLWEELCFAEAKNTLSPLQLLYADRLGKKKLYNNFKDPFYIQINSHIDKRRYLRPDLVYCDFEGSITNEHLGRIYKFEIINHNDYKNLKLIQKFKDHDFYELDEIYLEILNKNPKFRANSIDERNKFILQVDKSELSSKLNNYFTQFDKVEKFIDKRPCILNFTIIDYKYITEQSCVASILSDERKLDIKKQLIYEYSLQLNYIGCDSISEFWIPHYFSDKIEDYEEIEELNSQFIDSNIIVYKRNFLKLQEIYNNA